MLHGCRTVLFFETSDWFLQSAKLCFFVVGNQKNVFSKKNETKWSLNPHDFYEKGFECATLRF